MDFAARLHTLLLSDPIRHEIMSAVAGLSLPNCWIRAGFVRDAVWDHLHGYGSRPPGGDIDVLLFALACTDGATDRCVERQLRSALPACDWSVKNQARMHLRNRDAPYHSVADAMRHWPETATAVAVRLCPTGEVEINAPFGLHDLFTLQLRPTPALQAAKQAIFQQRLSSKRWLERYPLLSVAQ